MSKADKEILTAIRNRRDLERPMVSVRGLLKQVDRENYLDMCCSRLADSELLDGEDACIDFTDFPNIELSADGLQNCKSILECYISRDLLRQVYTIMCRTERLNCAISNYAEILRRMTASQLLKAHLGMKPGEDAAVYIRAELWSRSIFAEIVRKVQYGCTKLYVHIKYHRISELPKMQSQREHCSATRCHSLKISSRRSPSLLLIIAERTAGYNAYTGNGMERLQFDI